MRPSLVCWIVNSVGDPACVRRFHGKLVGEQVRPVGPLGDPEGEEAAALQLRDGFAFQQLIGAHQDGKQAQERDVQAVRVRRAKIREDLKEPRAAQQVEFTSKG